MSAAKVIKQIMLETDTSVKDLAVMLGMKSSQILSNKLYRDTFTFEDYIKIVNLMGCTVQTTVNSNGKIYINEYNPTPTLNISETEKTKQYKQPVTKVKEPVTPKQEYQYRIFTEQEAAKIDLNKLLSDNRYQAEIAMDFGMEVLSTLVNTARQQSEPSTSS